LQFVENPQKAWNISPTYVTFIVYDIFYIVNSSKGQSAASSNKLAEHESEVSICGSPTSYTKTTVHYDHPRPVKVRKGFS